MTVWLLHLLHLLPGPVPVLAEATRVPHPGGTLVTTVDRDDAYGDKRVGLAAVKALYGGTYASFASGEIAEELAGSPSGTILPFSFDERLDLFVDPGLLVHPEFHFAPARLDRSIALSSDGYLDIAEPRVVQVSAD
ncbi:hypothetical protein SUDANB15_00146 [Streptomyces sp. enrichment culture]